MIMSKLLRQFGLGAFIITVFGFSVALASASTTAVNFESPAYTLGTINLQDGWSSFGAAGSGCAVYDHAVSSSLSTPGFGTQSLRISNAVTSGCFSDQTFSKSLTDEAGETLAQNGGMSSGTRQKHFEAEWSFASAVPGAEQPGLSVVASPDRGDGARMSWVQMADTPAGLAVNFFDYQDGAVEPAGTCTAGSNFVSSAVVTGLDRSIPHKIKITMDFVDGANNDIVKVYVDGVLKHTGTSWEGYFNYCEGNPTRTVDSVLFRTGGTAAPATLGNGFLIDNLTVSSGPIPPVLTSPTNKNQCKKDGWKTFNNPVFKNQGQCIKFVENLRDNHDDDDDGKDRNDHDRSHGRDD